MKQYYSETDKTHYYLLIEPESRYQLQISMEERTNPSAHVTFRVPCSQDFLAVTGRDFEEYCEILGLDSVYHGYQHLEVGGGLSGFITHLALSRNRRFRPIIIDPVNYNHLKGLLEYALQERREILSEIDKKRLRTLLKRIEIIQDPNLVRLVNVRLSDALHIHPDLIQSSDVVLDVYGPSYHHRTEIPNGTTGHALKIVTELEQHLVKPGGHLIQHF